jgi:hypothetical protein
MIFNRFTVAMYLLLVLTNVYSQYENSFFDNDKYEQSIDSSHFQFHFDNMSYFRNAEYLSRVDKGSTYIGFHAMPYVQYSFNEKAQIFWGIQYAV